MRHRACLHVFQSHPTRTQSRGRGGRAPTARARPLLPTGPRCHRAGRRPRRAAHEHPAAGTPTHRSSSGHRPCRPGARMHAPTLTCVALGGCDVLPTVCSSRAGPAPPTPSRRATGALLAPRGRRPGASKRLTHGHAAALLLVRHSRCARRSCGHRGRPPRRTGGARLAAGLGCSGPGPSRRATLQQGSRRAPHRVRGHAVRLRRREARPHRAPAARLSPPQKGGGRAPASPARASQGSTAAGRPS